MRLKLIRNVPTIVNDIYNELILTLDNNIPTVGEGTRQTFGQVFTD